MSFFGGNVECKSEKKVNLRQHFR